jgi:hypothetical protein
LHEPLESSLKMTSGGRSEQPGRQIKGKHPARMLARCPRVERQPLAPLIWIEAPDA